MSHFARANLSPNDPGYYDTNSKMIYFPVGVFLAICPIVVGTRIWSRLGNGGHLGADDWTILVSLAKTPDPTYDIASTMWTIIEMNVALVCACLPQIRPLIIKWFPRLMPAYYSNSREQSDKRPAYSSNGLSTSHPSSSESHSKSEEDKWMRINSRKVGYEGANLTDFRRADSSSDEYMLHEEKGLQIQKTVQYTVEYSPDGKRDPYVGSMV
ncbi:hypothetical protein Daesc_005765 [Daldinia eschscholtzii]|uniref:Rhodopsin domain-containing protein n=1 Tax=Daldinia eschscholtzii TaxID=292717 RepID=A0AAX6MMP5_9PEZI